MYLTKAFTSDDLSKWYALIDNYSLSTVIATSHMEISNIPLMLHHLDGKSFLRGHLARANPLFKILESGDCPLLCIFNGPNGYVSPSYYPNGNFNVPTWNYAVVHVSGTANLVDTDKLIQILDESINKFELNKLNQWSIDWKNALAIKKLDGIAGFEVEINHIQGKFKLSQNRTLEEIQEVVSGLEQNSNELASFMKQIYGFK